MDLKIMFWLRIFLTTLFSASFGFAFHVLYGRGWASEYMDNAIKSGRMDGVLQEPYPFYIVAIAALTALIPTAGKVIIWLFIRDKIPGKRLWIKAFFFTGILIIADGGLLRQDIMNYLVGMPLDVWFVYGMEQWVIVPVMCILIVVLSPKKRE